MGRQKLAIPFGNFHKGHKYKRIGNLEEMPGNPHKLSSEMSWNHIDTKATIFLQRSRIMTPMGNLLDFILWDRQGHTLILNYVCMQVWVPMEHITEKLVR
jgi:hypothetical protein